MLNINADYLARAVAISLGAKKLILMTDVKGVLENGQVLEHLNLVDVQKKIDSGVITGGMIPKIQSAVQTVENSFVISYSLIMVPSVRLSPIMTCSTPA